MDRVEFGIKIEQMEKLHKRGEDASAAQIADSIDWRKVKKWVPLQLGAEIYEGAGRLKDARDICIYAYNRNLGGRRLVYKMTELSIAIGDMEEAEDLYSEYIELAPHDSGRYVLMYELFKAKGASDEKLIEVLEEFKANEPEDRYEYELAQLYAKVGRIDACVNECDDLILWFNDGEYVEKALLLKRKYAELTKSQEEKLTKMLDYREAGLEYRQPDYVESPEDAAESVDVQPKDYSIYDTQNIQAELARSLAEIMQDMEAENEGKTSDSWMRPMEREEEPEPVEDAADEWEEVEDDAAFIEESPNASEMQEVHAEDVVATENATVAEEEPSVEETEDDLAALDYSEEPIAEDTEEIEAAPSQDESEVKVELPEEAYTDDDYEINTLAPEDEIHYVPSPEVAAMLKEFEEESDWGEDTTDLARVVSQMAGGFDEDVEDLSEKIEDIEESEELSESEETTETAVEAPAPMAPETGVFFTLEPSSATVDPGSVHVVEMSTEKEDEVDEPTREIIINTHRWNRIRSEMEPLKPNIPEEEAEEELEEETPVVEETDEEPEVLEPEASEPGVTEDEAIEETSELETTESVIVAEESAEEPQEEIIEGQIDLLDYVASMPTEMPTEPETPMEEIEQAVAEVVEAVDEESHISEEEETVEEAVDEANEELTLQLQAEVFAYMNDVPAEEEQESVEAEEAPEAAESEVPEVTDEEEKPSTPKPFAMSETQKKYIGRYLYMQGMETKIVEILRGKAAEQKDGTSAHGNIAILGKSDTDKEAFAINLFKAIHAGNGATNLKIAKTKAEILNHRGIDATREKLIGTTLIIEHAGKLEQRTVADLIDFMHGDTENMEVILTGEDYVIRKLFVDFPELEEMFDYQITLKRYTTNDLVAIATEYAREKGYRIEEKALDNLFLAINSLRSNDAGTEVAGAQKIIDDAIAKNPKKRMLRSGALIPLKAKHFVRR